MAINTPSIMYPSLPAPGGLQSPAIGGWRQEQMENATRNRAPLPSLPSGLMSPFASAQKTIPPVPTSPIAAQPKPSVPPQVAAPGAPQAVGAAGPTRALRERQLNLQRDFGVARGNWMASAGIDRSNANYQRYADMMRGVGNIAGLQNVVNQIKQQEQFLQKPPLWAQNMAPEERANYMNAVSVIPNQVESAVREVYPELFALNNKIKYMPGDKARMESTKANIKKGIDILGDVSESFIPEPELQRPSMAMVRQYGAETAESIQEQRYKRSKNLAEQENLQRTILYDLRRSVIQRSLNGQIDAKSLAQYTSDLADAMLSGNLEAIAKRGEDLRKREEAMAQRFKRDSEQRRLLASIQPA